MNLDNLLISALIGALLFAGYFIYLKHTASDEYKIAHKWQFDFIVVYMIIAPFVGGGVGMLTYYVYHILTS